MSLINDALKKAQRLRAEEQTETASPGNGGRVVKRSQPRAAKSLLLLATGGIVLVVLSVVVTVYLINRPSPSPKPSGTQAAPGAAPAPTPLAPLVVPTIPVPAEPSPAVTPAATPGTAGATKTPVPPDPPKLVAADQSASPASATSAGSSSPAAPAETPPAPGPAVPDPRVHAFIDSLRVNGIRPSGTESRVLMNERVYRVNDIVDRTLGLRLTNVEPGNLTFTDVNGVTYAKPF